MDRLPTLEEALKNIEGGTHFLSGHTIGKTRFPDKPWLANEQVERANLVDCKTLHA
jgi:hypothetical protein